MSTESSPIRQPFAAIACYSPGLGNKIKTFPKEDIMKEFQCGSLVPGCEWHTRHEEEAEIMRRAAQHMRETHGETVIRETMVEAIRSRIEKVRNAA